jgi:hypothetical protein
VPHVVLEGRITIEDCQKHFQPSVEREGELLVKFDRFYLERGGRSALIETLVVDHGHTQKFFIHLSPKGEGITVRLEPLTDPEKSAGVKRALALAAHGIRKAAGGSYGKTNIGEFLIP